MRRVKRTILFSITQIDYMKLKELPQPIILMWDVPADSRPYSPFPNGVFYPVLVGEHHPMKHYKPQCDWRLVYTRANKNWMAESEHLREPTETELSTFSDDIAKLYKKYQDRNL